MILKNNIVSIAGSGVVMGSAASLLILTAGGSVVAFDSLTLIGVITGYGILAGVGGVTVLEIYRHMTKQSQKDNELYRLKIKSLKEPDKTFIVEQNYPRYPLNTKVTVFERDGLFFIRKR